MNKIDAEGLFLVTNIAVLTASGWRSDCVTYIEVIASARGVGHPRVTSEAVRPVMNKEIPGPVELMRCLKSILISPSTAAAMD